MEKRVAQKIVAAINSEFGFPFLPKDFVKAEVTPELIQLTIGSRDLRIDFEGNILGTGSLVGGANPWGIVKHERTP